jgi:eukaryotic-like serine/threonine-protein kinase
MRSPDPTTLQAAFAAFDRWLDCAAERRAEFLESLAASQPAVHAQLLRLIEGDRRATQSPPLPADGVALLQGGPEPSTGSGGQTLGPYRLQRKLGVGGWGEVWLARRDDGLYRGEAAVKLLHAHLLAPELRQRFRREGQILASLSHPHIARLLDAGLTPEGLPYYVLEYVPGEPIDRYCDAQRLGVEARVRLFLDVCAAVAHAHVHLVVHRDLKPSNMLVTAEGEVKLLDFGIAKLLAADEAQESLLTRIAGRALTPEYAAPEQFDEGVITTATDVYALGVVLYELLSGQRPPASGPRRNVEESPPRLPAAASDAAATARGCELPQLRRALRGDLENVVARALSFDPRARYASAQALADDLQRYLHHEPVRAQAETFAYRAGKFLRRHRGAVAAAVVALGSLLAAVAGVLWQARLAEAEAQRATRVKEFLVSVFREQDPRGRPRAEARPPQQILADAAQTLEQELRDEPRLRAELLDDLGEIAVNLGDVSGGRALLEKARVERQALFGSDSAELAETLRKLSWAAHASGSVQEALNLARDAVDIWVRRAETAGVEAARAQSWLAFCLAFGRGAPPEALALVAAAQRTLEARQGPDHPETIQAIARHSEMLEQARRDVEAEPMVREALRRIERAQGADSARLTEPLLLLSRLLKRNGRYEEAEAVYRRTAQLMRRHLGARHASLAAVLTSQGDLYQILRRYPEAEQAFLEAEAALPEGESATRMEWLTQRGQFLLETRQLAQAEADLRRAFELRRARMGEGNGFTWFTASEWGRALAALGRLDEAETIQREAQRRLAAILGPGAFQNSLVSEALAETLELRGRYDEALALRRQALALVEASYVPTHATWARSALRLAQALARQPAQRDEARTLAERAVATLRAAAPQAPEIEPAQALLQHLRSSP